MTHFTKTKISGVYVAEPEVFRDGRGYFMERFRMDEWERIVGPVRFIQENESFSMLGVMRGLHYQLPPYGQSKLVQVVWGAIRDVVVDMRPKSPTFGKHHVEILDDRYKKQLFVPAGFAHGFLVTSPEAVVHYKVDAPYHPTSERTLRFDDPFLHIDWGVSPDSCHLSEKDRNGYYWETAMFEIMNNY
ncbi:MAG: dTDP-4-dehydrorhamnose 3,5-epimerase [Prevotellaceae bacterium]|jgi:dTDP-4-dehydrorhamnose 3,5-epimerase|nr:dTDP-4-dehydrorhamnose 3,5-epimerase [Prevotellaceae bacterium]